MVNGTTRKKKVVVAFNSNPGLYTRIARKTLKIRRKHEHGQDSNPVPLEHESRALPLQQVA
jgi:hypothetical protein